MTNTQHTIAPSNGAVNGHSLSRRKLVAGAAWAAPVIALAVAAPAASASGLRTFVLAQEGDYWNPAAGGLFTNLRFQLSSSDGQAIANKTFVVSVGSSGSVRFGAASGAQPVYSVTLHSNAAGVIDVTNLYRRAAGSGGLTNGESSLVVTPLATEYDAQTETAPAPLTLAILDKRSIQVATLTSTAANSSVASLVYPAAAANVNLPPSNAANTNAAVPAFYLHYLITEGSGWFGSGNPQISATVRVVSGARLVNGNPNNTSAWLTEATLLPGRNSNTPNNLIGPSNTVRLYRFGDEDIVLQVDASFENTLLSNGTPAASPVTTFSREIIIPNPNLVP